MRCPLTSNCLNGMASLSATCWSPHKKLMYGLLDRPGVYRTGGVGVMAGKRVLHMAPPAGRVPILMSRLFGWLRGSKEHPLIASSVFHYEFEFIHPFADGNGRMGRLWQTLLLSQWQPAFAWLPVESPVHQQQAAYYKAINASTAATDCAPFIRFMLGCIHDAIGKASSKAPVKTTVETTVKTPVEKQARTPQQILAVLGQQPELTPGGGRSGHWAFTARRGARGRQTPAREQITLPRSETRRTLGSAIAVAEQFQE